MDKIAITTGDPNGIGAEITIKALKKIDLPVDKIVLISNKKILDYYGKLDKNYEIVEIPYETKDIKAGEITKEAGDFAFKSLLKVCELQKMLCILQDTNLMVKRKFYKNICHIMDS